MRRARAALDHCAWTTESLRARLRHVDENGTRRQRIALRGLLNDLDKRRDHLTELHAAMASVPADASAGQWHAFQEAYRGFQRVASAGRTELDLAGWQDGAPVSARADPG